MDKKYYRHYPWVIWLTIVLVLSFLPGDKIPEIKFTLFKIDKVIHFTLYFILALLMCFAFYLKNNEPFIKRVVLIIAVGILTGYFVEVIQGNFIKNRFFDVFDIIANSLGTLVGFMLFVNYLKIKLKHW